MHNNNNNNKEKSNMQQTGSGLTRYRSAPSSYFADLLESNNSSGGGLGADDFEQIFNPRATSPETQRIFSRFMSNSETVPENGSLNVIAQSQSQLQLNYSQFLPPRNNKEQLQIQQSTDYSSVSVSQMMYQNVSSEAPNYVMDSLRVFGSINSNLVAHTKMEGSGGGSNLFRHRSSPAGLFDNINIEKEFGTMRGMGNIGAGTSSNAEASFSSVSRLNNRPGEGQFHDDFFGDDSTILSDNFLNELADNNDNKTFLNVNASDDQNNEVGNQPMTRLSHHLSLPSSSSELSAMDKLLQDSVPCRIRAKRGFATHPRSIAERVRRTKISERMRKLQELVPNMEKQTNTADMLDLAVDYIKDLQTQVKKFSDTRANCSCSAKEKP